MAADCCSAMVETADHDVYETNSLGRDIRLAETWT